jgi:hypothetical protein
MKLLHPYRVSNNYQFAEVTKRSAFCSNAHALLSHTLRFVANRFVCYKTHCVFQQSVQKASKRIAFFSSDDHLLENALRF